MDKAQIVPGARLDIALLSVLCAVPLHAQTNTTSGEFIVEPPTFISLGFEWRISGDQNRNAHVDVDYRRRGDTQWRQGLPLMRSQNEQIGVAAAPGQPTDLPAIRFSNTPLPTPPRPV